MEPLKGPLPPMTKSMQNLRNKVRTVLKVYYNKPLNSHDNDPWEMMHGMLAYGVHSHIREGGPKGDLITSVGWLCYNKPCKGQTLMYVTPDGELRAKYGVGLQGHMGQLLAMLAQCRVSPDYPIQVGDHEFTIRDLIEAEKKTCYREDRADVQADRVAALSRLGRQVGERPGHGVGHPEADQRRAGPADSRRGLRRHASPVGLEPGGARRGCGAASRSTANSPRPASSSRSISSYAFQLQNSRRQLEHRVVPRQGRRRRHRSPHQDDRPHSGMALLLAERRPDCSRLACSRPTNYLATLLYTNYDHEWEKGPVGPRDPRAAAVR